MTHLNEIGLSAGSGSRHDRMQHVGKGCGKLILLGEHSVVYGKPAIAMSVNRGVTATLEEFDGRREDSVLEVTEVLGSTQLLTTNPTPDGDPMSRAFWAVLDRFAIDCAVNVTAQVHIPIRSGMGSSAAIATAIARALYRYVICEIDSSRSDSVVDEAITDFETIFHGKPSGIDQAAASGYGVFLFQRERMLSDLGVTSLPLVVCVADDPSSTFEEVARVADCHRQRPDFFGEIDSLIESLVCQGAEALREGDFATFGELMNLNHGLLTTMGCSTARLDEARWEALRHGALGAKLTGAGGGGCIFALAPSATQQDAILQAWTERGLSAFAVDTTPQLAAPFAPSSNRSFGSFPPLR